MAWNPDQYHKFRDEREAPFVDLVALATWQPQLRIVDLGCGTGELTARLCDLSPGADVLGIDSSANMLERARTYVEKHQVPGLRFAQASIEEFTFAQPVDLLFSHAALQWVEDHPSLFERLVSGIKPGGQLLVQMPSNHDHISHRLVRELAASSPWRERLGGFVRHSPVLTIDAYAELLHRLGLHRPTVIEKIYGQVMPDSGAVLEWVRGTLLVPYLERLGAAYAQEFIDVLSARYATAMPEKPYYHAFRRTLIAASRPRAEQGTAVQTLRSD